MFSLWFVWQTSALWLFVCKNQSVPTLLYIWMTYISCYVVILKAAFLLILVNVFMVLSHQWRYNSLPHFSLQEFTCTPWLLLKVLLPPVVGSWRICKCVRPVSLGAVQQCYPQTGDLARVRLCVSFHCWPNISLCQWLGYKRKQNCRWFFEQLIFFFFFCSPICCQGIALKLIYSYIGVV